MFIIKKFRLFITMLVLVALQGCATHPSPHGTPSTGFSADIHTPIGGIDASVGVHAVNGTAIAVGGPSRVVQQQGGRWEACEPTAARMQSSYAETLFQMASNGDPEKVDMDVTLTASDNMRTNGYNCWAKKSAGR